jgi:hypothetical protein
MWKLKIIQNQELTGPQQINAQARIRRILRARKTAQLIQTGQLRREPTVLKMEISKFTKEELTMHKILPPIKPHNGIQLKVSWNAFHKRIDL